MPPTNNKRRTLVRTARHRPRHSLTLASTSFANTSVASTFASVRALTFSCPLSAMSGHRLTRVTIVFEQRSCTGHKVLLSKLSKSYRNPSMLPSQADTLTNPMVDCSSPAASALMRNDITRLDTRYGRSSSEKIYNQLDRMTSGGQKLWLTS